MTYRHGATNDGSWWRSEAGAQSPTPAGTPIEPLGAALLDRLRGRPYKVPNVKVDALRRAHHNTFTSAYEGFGRATGVLRLRAQM